MTSLALPLLALLFLSSKKAPAVSATAPAASTAKGVRVIGQVLSIPLRDGSSAIVAKLQEPGNQLDAIVIARGTVYGSRNGAAAVLRCGNEADAKAIASEIRGKF